GRQRSDGDRLWAECLHLESERQKWKTGAFQRPHLLGGDFNVCRKQRALIRRRARGAEPFERIAAQALERGVRIDADQEARRSVADPKPVACSAEVSKRRKVAGRPRRVAPLWREAVGHFGRSSAR